MNDFNVVSSEEFAFVEKMRKESRRNPNYVLWNFDDNMEKVINEGFILKDRTGTGCKVLPGVLSTVDISKRIPVPTRRATAWKSMLKEYLWFLSGSHNINDLNKMGSKVWDFWKDDTFTTENGFPQGSIGYGYGFNLLHFGGDINNIEQNPGFNQLDYVVNELKNNKSSRRILFIFYRPDKADNKNVKLPACHVAYQFVPEADETGELTKLNCCVYQRSSDAYVGNLSTNLQGASFLTYMLAQQANMTPNKLFHFSANFHLYNDHINLVKEYLNRESPNSPILKLNKRESIYDYTVDDFVLEDYNPQPKQIVPISI
jgi:thymidylate synthase